MLKHEDNLDGPSQPAAPISVSQARVTPEELAQALAAIEVKRQAEASRLAGTIPIDQAVSELHLDSTSDEIWAEVQVQRAKAAASSAERLEAEPQEAKEKRVPFQPALRPVTVPELDFSKTRRRGWRGILAPVLVIGILMSAGVIPHPWRNFHVPFTAPHVPAAAPILRPLSAVPDGKEVYADDAALIQLSEGKPAAQVTVSINSTGNRWNLIKTGGHLYLRGYIESTNSLSLLEGKPLNVYNDDDSGELNGDRTSEITLRVDGIPLQKSGGDEGYSEVTIPNFQRDPLDTLSPWH